MATEQTQEQSPLNAEPREQHAWLRRLEGEWVFETGMPVEPGAPAETMAGRESVRFLGELWLVAEGEGEIPGGGSARHVMTLGYDPRQGRFVGSWVGSPMDHMFVYEGTLDAAGRVLTLDTTGPDFEDVSRTRRYRDVIEIEDDDHRILTGNMLGDDGEWQELMRSRYRRV